MPLTQGLAQDTPQGRQPGARRQQPQRPRLPVRVVVQCTAAQLTQPQRIAYVQLPGPVAKRAGAAAIQVKLQRLILCRQARQRVGAGHIAAPQHQMLASLCNHRGWQAILQRIEQRHPQVAGHRALAGQAPALVALGRTQGLGPGILGLAIEATYQAGVAAAGAAAVGHIQACLVEGIQ
ncbi:hypothetical protein WR25_01939 [Diploscapter pachys]|uniref:Uncharacterized protein n=1 Tax=Diploscapter pachys TaxID=2018661 RepID=A0A2A2M486_9BILA|nr:hypothetical protein WR25_01939 [Diploscapter pachys]